MLVYPVILSEEEDCVLVHSPDFDIDTQGKDYADALFMIRDAICITAISRKDDFGEAIPDPSPLKDVVAEPGEIVALVDVDIEAYRRALENRTVKKNCTLPSWLNEKAEKSGVNFSAVLQEALIAKLGA